MPPPSFVINVRGIPKPQPRPRFVRGRVVSNTDPKVKAWKDAVARETRNNLAVAIKGAVAVESVFFMPTKDKSRWGKPHTLKPDRDNLDKAVLDAMTTAGAWADDSVVWSGGARKVWCKPGNEGAVIAVVPTPSPEPIMPPWGRILQPPGWFGGIPA